MSEVTREEKPIPRLESGISGLDEILNGGFLKGGTYMVMGRPGAGKTTFGNQIAFHHARSGKNVLYVTLLAEAHDQMIARLRSMSFFTNELVGTRVFYVSGYEALEKNKLDGLLTVLRRLMREYRADLLFIDGVLTMSALGESPIAIKRFIHELQTLAGLLACTTFLLTGGDTGHDNYTERTMVDGLVLLQMRTVGMRAVRELEVLKFRGSSCLSGVHVFQICDQGIVTHPRLESVLRSERPEAARRRLSLGVPALDAMTDGGLLAASSTLVLGAPGSGKTILGLHFLTEGARRGEKGLYFGFYEPPVRLIAQADGLGLGLRRHVESGAIALHWTSPLELLADELARRILDEVDRSGTTRLVVDGLDGIQQAVLFTERLPSFFTALSNGLRHRGVATLFAKEARQVYGPMMEAPSGSLSAIADNVVSLRYEEVEARLRRFFSVLKMRESGYEPVMREFAIGEGGISVDGIFERGQPPGLANTRPRRAAKAPAAREGGRRQGRAVNEGGGRSRAGTSGSGTRAPAKGKGAKRSPPGKGR